MNKYGYDLSKLDKKIQKIIERLFACADTGKVEVNQYCDTQFWITEGRGYGFGGLNAIIAPATGEVSFWFDGINGESYMYLKNNLDILFCKHSFMIGDIPLLEETVFNCLRAKVRQIELSPVDFE